MSSILDSKKLISSIKRRAFIPESQETFSQDDFLEMATEEVNIGLMDQIMTARGDYLVYFEDIALDGTQTEFPIPSRAHGNKLRDAHIVSSDGRTVKELTQITLDELADYDTNFQNADAFYLRNNLIILTSAVVTRGDYLRLYFYMRPNKLVLNERAVTASAIATGYEIDTVEPNNGSITEITDQEIVTSANHNLNSGDFVIITGSDSTPSIDGIYSIAVISPNSFSITGVDVTIPGTVGSWNLAVEVYTATSVVFPKHFTTAITYDIVAAVSPNKIKHYDLYANSINNTTKTISFRVSDIGTDFVVGDYVTKAEETIVPNLPTEYHSVLAQMVAVACLESMGDTNGMQSAEKKLNKMQKSVLNIVTNRVEGAPKKIKNRNGTLNQTMNSRIYRSRG